jgi:hypothetical protein
VLRIGERTRRQPLLSREQFIAPHRPTVRRGRYSDNGRGPAASGGQLPAVAQSTCSCRCEHGSMADGDAKLHVLINGWRSTLRCYCEPSPLGSGSGHRVFAPVTGLGAASPRWSGSGRGSSISAPCARHVIGPADGL